ncbi:pyridoxal-phosphate dependent enzyme [Cronobacter sakazakii]|uniref:pyridoxal-phosphate dependent enzyme n=1 Tax=Cronobacter sakazakii TaxID=28141 RepID=UPI00398B63FB
MPLITNSRHYIVQKTVLAWDDFRIPSGSLEGLERNGLAGVPVIAVETEGAASFNAAAKAGRVTPIARIESVATSLGAKQVCDQAVKYSGSRPVVSALVSDYEAVSASRNFADDHRMVTEQACGAGLACFYGNKEVLAPFRNPLMIVCGGATMSLEQLVSLHERFG